MKVDGLTLGPSTPNFKKRCDVAWSARQAILRTLGPKLPPPLGTSAKRMRAIAAWMAEKWPDGIDDEVLIAIEIAEMGNAFAQELATYQAWSVVWHQHGYPCFSVDDPLAAALAMSDAGDDVDSVKPPFPAMMFVPPKWMPDVGAIIALKHRRTTGEDLWTIQNVLPGGDVVWRCMQPASWHVQNLPGAEGNHDHVDRYCYPQDYSDAESRTIQLSASLVFNACRVMEQTKPRRPAGLPREKATRHVVRQYERAMKAAPITIDFSEPCAEYIAGSSRKYKARWVVRGHHRNQPCGKGRKERKRLWVQPHWKGPANGAMAQKDYQL